MRAIYRHRKVCKSSDLSKMPCIISHKFQSLCRIYRENHSQYGSWVGGGWTVVWILKAGLETQQFISASKYSKPLPIILPAIDHGMAEVKCKIVNLFLPHSRDCHVWLICVELAFFLFLKSGGCPLGLIHTMQMWTRKQYFLSPNWVFVQLELSKTHFYVTLLFVLIHHAKTL